MVTGATGFVGGASVRRLAADGHVVHAASTRDQALLPSGVVAVRAPDIGPDADWREAFDGVDIVVHTAARVHVMRESVSDPLAAFRRVNVGGTLALARQASRAGVRRLVFISSIKVNGERTEPGRPFTVADPPAPTDPYGVSKWEAEVGLAALAAETGLEVVVIRPVLVYGPGVTGNFRSMLQWLDRGVPLPLGAVANRRSLIGLDNLVDLIAASIQHPAAAGERFLAADGEDLSTTELLQRAAAALGRPARLVPVSAAWLRAAAAAVGKTAVSERLLGSLQVDISHANQLLQWRPPVTVDESLQRVAAWVRSGRAWESRSA